MPQQPLQMLELSTLCLSVWATERKVMMSVYMLTVRTLHLEVAPKLCTDSSINAIMQFIAWRGKPVTVISNSGTNFVGGEQKFANYVSAWNKEGIEEYLIQHRLG